MYRLKGVWRKSKKIYVINWKHCWKYTVTLTKLFRTCYHFVSCKRRTQKKGVRLCDESPKTSVVEKYSGQEESHTSEPCVSWDRPQGREPDCVIRALKHLKWKNLQDKGKVTRNISLVFISGNGIICWSSMVWHRINWNISLPGGRSPCISQTYCCLWFSWGMLFDVHDK